MIGSRKKGNAPLRPATSIVASPSKAGSTYITRKLDGVRRSSGSRAEWTSLGWMTLRLSTGTAWLAPR